MLQFLNLVIPVNLAQLNLEKGIVRTILQDIIMRGWSLFGTLDGKMYREESHTITGTSCHHFPFI